MKRFMEFVDDVLHDFSGQLSVDDIYHMTYKEIGYMREHRKKNYPPEAESLAHALLGSPTGKGKGKGKAAGQSQQNNIPPQYRNMLAQQQRRAGSATRRPAATARRQRAPSNMTRR